MERKADTKWDCSAGGLSYTQPAITAAASYYKIMQGNPITFGWTFTSLVCVFISPNNGEERED